MKTIDGKLEHSERVLFANKGHELSIPANQYVNIKNQKKRYYHIRKFINIGKKEKTTLEKERYIYEYLKGT